MATTSHEDQQHSSADEDDRRLDQRRNVARSGASQSSYVGVPGVHDVATRCAGIACNPPGAVAVDVSVGLRGYRRSPEHHKHGDDDQGATDYQVRLLGRRM